MTIEYLDFIKLYSAGERVATFIAAIDRLNEVLSCSVYIHKMVERSAIDLERELLLSLVYSYLDIPVSCFEGMEPWEKFVVI